MRMLHTVRLCMHQVLKEPADVVAARREAEAAANAARLATQRARADERARMKGRNKPTRRQKKKQLNIIEDRMPALRAKLQEEVGPARANLYSAFSQLKPEPVCPPLQHIGCGGFLA
jgi:type II secretory pathway component HofQ